MIKKLRVKFVAVAMLAMVLVLAALLTAINARSYAQVVGKADKTLAILAENDGKFPSRDPNEFEIIAKQYDGEEQTHADFVSFSGYESNFEKNANSALIDIYADFLARIPSQDYRYPSPETPFETRYFTVVFEDGEVEAIYTDNIYAVSPQEALAYANQALASKKEKGFHDNYRYLISVNGDETYCIFVDCTNDLETFNSFLKNSLLMSLLGVTVVFVLILVFSKIALKPVAESYEKQKRFVTDANHELKTPLTVISADCDVLEMTGCKNEWTDSIKNEVKKLTELTNALVFLARSDEQNFKFTTADFSISEACEESTEPYVGVCLAKGKKFERVIEKNVSFVGDQNEVKRLIGLLLDNAVKYSDEGGSIKFSLLKSGRECKIIVENTTSGVPKGKHDELFDRFYRRDNSRSRDTGGHGVGLSVAQAIANGHKGKITAYSPDGITMIFTVTL